MAVPDRTARRHSTRGNRGAEAPAIIESPLEVTRMPPNPKKRTSWKDGADRADRQFNAGPDAELRHADRRIELDERTRLRKAEKRIQRTARLASVAICADLEDEGTDWGDDNTLTIAQDAESASA